MKESLTQNELKIIQECIQFFDSWRRKFFLISIVVITGMIALMILLEESIELTIFTVILEIILMFCIWYIVFGKPAIKLKKDVSKGVKIIQSATIQKLKIKKGQKSYILSNGLEISEDDLANEKLELNLIKVGQKLTVTYTPHHKMVMNVKINDEFST